MSNPVCPTNQKAGKAVDSLILKAMLDVSLTNVTSPAYYFCRDSIARRFITAQMDRNVLANPICAREFSKTCNGR